MLDVMSNPPLPPPPPDDDEPALGGHENFPDGTSLLNIKS